MRQLMLKRFLKNWIPPAILKLYQRRHNSNKSQITYSGNYDFWQEALTKSTGYDSDLILDKVSSSLGKVKTGEAVYERDSVLFDKVEHSFPLMAGLFHVAAKYEGKLSVLDFGGSLGSTYFQCRDFLSVLPQIKWGIVEQDKFVRRGRERFESEQLRFFFSLQDCYEAIHPNVVLFSSVLQYLQFPFEILKTAMDSQINYIIIDRTQFSDLTRDWLSVQSVPPEIYSASYPCWIFSESYFKKVLSDQFELVSDFDALGGSGRIVGGVDFTFKGMIWRRR